MTPPILYAALLAICFAAIIWWCVWNLTRENERLRERLSEEERTVGFLRGRIAELLNDKAP